MEGGNGTEVRFEAPASPEQPDGEGVAADAEHRGRLIGGEPLPRDQQEELAVRGGEFAQGGHTPLAVRDAVLEGRGHVPPLPHGVAPEAVVRIAASAVIRCELAHGPDQPRERLTRIRWHVVEPSQGDDECFRDQVLGIRRIHLAAGIDEQSGRMLLEQRGKAGVSISQ